MEKIEKEEYTYINQSHNGVEEHAEKGKFPLSTIVSSIKVSSYHPLFKELVKACSWATIISN